MKQVKKIAFLIIGFIVMTSFSQCSSSKNLQKQAPLSFGEVYCQAWAGGVEAAGTGLNIFIPAEVKQTNNIALDSVYFRGKAVKLEAKEFNGTVTYIGRFVSKPNTTKDIIISNDPKEESENKIELPKPIPFELQDNECVVSYIENDEVKYFKINNVVERQQINYPAVRQNKR
ncbi:hypothetical protein [Winogradskyella sp. 3972H.M.0a.05]|uniref:hypothetical protein n=1 Tax=Winogradskyella sp. 3972H.M.0a.05 TaxID=2950277 RepID=UPI0033936FE2